ncbi:U3 small nucleolar RNA-associated protein 14, partial [Tremellales sp. Uapishka_1]
MARKPTRGSNPRAPFSASSTVKAAPPKTKSKRKLDPTNAYTYVPALPKRSRTDDATLSLTREEAGPSTRRRKPADEEEDEDEAMEERIRKLGMMIAEEGPGEVGDDDDEEVDSDEAFGEDGSDEDKWGDTFRDLEKAKRKKGKGKAVREVAKPAKPLNVDLDESEDETDPEVERSPKTAFKSAFPDEEEEEEEEEEDGLDEGDDDEEADEDEDDGEDDDEDDEEDDEETDLELPSDLSEDDDDPSALDGLDAFVDQLANADRKRKSEIETEVVEKKKRRVLPVASAPGLRDGGDFGLKSDEKLDLSTLISSHPSLSSASALLPSKADKKSSASILKQGILAAPLPTVVQERLDREAAYEKTKEEGQKWAGVMKRVKEAEHLSFPLQAKERGGVKSSGELIGSFKPGNKMESAVQALLNAANLTDSNLTQHEDDTLASQDLSIEEIASRRAELRHQRELMFRAESRAKRVAKIKSKTFRKLARKREAKNGGEVSLEDMERLDPEAAEEEREKLERQRALERATQRHGAKNGRWAREVGGDGAELDERRKEKEEMLDLKEKLTRRIQGKGDRDEEESEEESEDEDEENVKLKAFDQLASLDANEKPEERKGLMGMAFMKKAEQRGMRKVAEEENELRREIELFGEKSDADSEDEDEDEGLVLKVGGNEGRLVFSGPGAIQEPEAPQPTPTIHETYPEPSRIRSPSPSAANPWLNASSASGPSRKRNALLNQNSSAADKTTKALKKLTKQQEAGDDVVEIDITGGPAGSEDEDDLMPINGVKAFKQRDLVAEAFAGDNVVLDFSKDKQRQIDHDAPTTEDTSLPGWGSWGGKGTRKKAVDPKFLVKTAGIEPTQRKDFTRKNVIISEKKDKKASAFLVKDLPYPYTSKAQFEASFNTPLGAEWNSRGMHQKETMPRVVKKPGAIIEPVQRLF